MPIESCVYRRNICHYTKNVLVFYICIFFLNISKIVCTNIVPVTFFHLFLQVTPPLDLETMSKTLKEKNILPSNLKFGFLGLGIMGSGIVKNLINSGHSVIVWNRTQEKVCINVFFFHCTACIKTFYQCIIIKIYILLLLLLNIFIFH